MKLSDLRRFSPFTYFWERTFFYLQYLSPANLLLRTRVRTQMEFDDARRKEEITIRRGRRIEAYVLTWFLLLVICAFCAPDSRGLLRLACIALPCFRVFEILQSAINMNIFDPAPTRQAPPLRLRRDPDLGAEPVELPRDDALLRGDLQRDADQDRGRRIRG